jgi:hypothetical protein
LLQFSTINSSQSLGHCFKINHDSYPFQFKVILPLDIHNLCCWGNFSKRTKNH